MDGGVWDAEHTLEEGECGVGCGVVWNETLTGERCGCGVRVQVHHKIVAHYREALNELLAQ